MQLFVECGDVRSSASLFLTGAFVAGRVFFCDNSLSQFVSVFRHSTNN